MIHRDVEEPLDLLRVQIHRDHAVGPRRGKQVGHQLRRDRNTRLILAILAGITVEGNDGCDLGCRRAARRVNHDQQLHQVFVGRVTRRLDDVHVAAADVLDDLDVDLAVRKTADGDLAQRLVQVLRDLLGQRPIGIACENPHVLFLIQ